MGPSFHTHIGNDTQKLLYIHGVETTNLDKEEVGKQFAYTFAFYYEQLTVDATLQEIKEKIFAKIPIKVVNSHQCSATI